MVNKTPSAVTTGYKLSMPSSSQHQKMTTAVSAITYKAEANYMKEFELNRPISAIQTAMRPVTALNSKHYPQAFRLLNVNDTRNEPPLSSFHKINNNKSDVFETQGHSSDQTI